jgi:hypothetical protein
LINVAYVEVNDHALSNAGCYSLTSPQRPFFDVAVIFAANISGNDPNDPEIYFNPQVSHLLNQDLQQVQSLQLRGIKVVLTLLGNHQRAGWSGMNDPNAAQRFADRIADVVQRYNLDGIDIDDEYSNYAAVFPASTTMIAQALVNNPKFRGKILSKALFSDRQVFTTPFGQFNLAQLLNYGSEMTYRNPDAAGRLEPYIGYRMKKSGLLIGVSADNDPAAGTVVNYVKNNGYGGVMVYNVGATSGRFLSSLADIEFGDAVSIVQNCLH